MGVCVNLHMCGKKIKVVSINDDHKNQCKCGKKMRKGCCKNISFSIKLSENQKKVHPILVPQTVSCKVCTLRSSILFSPSMTPIYNSTFSNYHAPPLKTKQAVFLLNNVFLI